VRPSASSALREQDRNIKGVGGLAFPLRQELRATVRDGHSCARARTPSSIPEDSGLNEIVATASADNPAALRWLRRLGFVEAREQKIEVLF
jgi:hypothetical protein